MPPSTSTVDPSLPPLTPVFSPLNPPAESAPLQALIKHLALQQHVEGGYFVETDRDARRVPSPFSSLSPEQPETRSASTTIHYLLTPTSPLGAFHRNRGRTIHTLHRGRGRYVIVHADEVASEAFPGGYSNVEGHGGAEGEEQARWTGKKARVETFIVGPDILRGERLQWIVEGGKYKSSFLLPDSKDVARSDETTKSEGLLISETVVPGFEFEDHDFLRRERLEALVTREQVAEMEWMLRKDTSE